MKKPRLGAALVFIASLAVPAAVRSAEPPNTVIVSQTLDMHSTDTETISVFTDNVVVTGNDLRITCDRLDVVSTRIGDKTDTIGKQENFKSLIATGHVHIVQQDREASCGRATVLPRQNKITLTENPVVIDHGNNSVATGEPLVLLRGERRITGQNVRITLPAIKDLGFDKNIPPPKPEAPATVP
ncbi:MAG TPA: LptA/OstA family protein [Opitutaceae bacterium]|nr:LptA/OstA family protein [Opitutaceae bacterium]